MPPSTRDSETAAMYKSLLLRTLSVDEGDEPGDIRFDAAFRPLCVIEGKSLDGNQAYSRAWLAHMDEQVCAAEAARRPGGVSSGGLVRGVSSAIDFKSIRNETN